MSIYGDFANEIKELSKKLNSPTIDVGTVTQEDPLEIQKGELPIYAEDVLVADYLTDQYKREMEYTWKDDGMEGRFIRPIQYRDKLKVGDEVALLSVASGQRYIVLCRVVKYE